MPDRILRKIGKNWVSEDLRLTRRAMMRSSAAALGATLLSGALIGCESKLERSQNAGRPTSRPVSGDKPRVIVIGAGFSGLACAYELMSAGCDVTITESRGRTGGRVLTLRDYLPGRNIEGGGEWVGTNHLHWVNYMQKFGLTLNEASEDEGAIRYFLQGKLLDEAQSKEVEEGLEAIEKALTEQSAIVNADEPWLTPGAAELDALTIAGFIERQEVSPLAKAMADLLFSADNAVPSSSQSYLANLTMVKAGGGETYWTDSEVGRCAQGNDALAARLVEAIGAERLMLNRSVVRIEQGARWVIVTLKDGTELTCDEVVCTAPPSTWDKINFTDLLPAGASVQMGRSVKYARAVKSRFWKEKGLNQECHSEHLSSETWDAADNQPGDDAVLANFISCSQAERALAIGAADLDAAMGEELERLFPGYGEHVSGKSVFMNWVKDPQTRGSYSFARPGAITTVAPLLHRSTTNLHFAGEHTCPAYVGYMEGALSSGARVARQIVERAKSPVKAV
jgi:monoamine oxidase